MNDAGLGNSEFPWDTFDSRAYHDHNYAFLRSDDRQILGMVRDFFASAYRNGQISDDASGLDAGSGTNLYPALSMLPFCGEITLWEHSAANVGWLERQMPGYGPSWDPFWDLLAGDPLYAAVADPRKTLAGRAKVRRGSIFDLPQARWDLGTMFFVAESMTADIVEFRAAVRCFLRALRPGAPFAAAFMENSTGYQVGDTRFPAVAITEADLKDCFAGCCAEVRIMRVDSGDDPLRDGYTGMMLALGWTSEADR